MSTVVPASWFSLRARRTDRWEWVWYAPAFASDLPNTRHEFIVDRVLGAGMAFAGIDVGESYGSPAGRALFTAFHRHVTKRYGLADRAVLLSQSRGGLMHYTWASEHPDLVRRDHSDRAHSAEETLSAYERIRAEADILVPLYDLGVFDRHPHGIGKVAS